MKLTNKKSNYQIVLGIATVWMALLLVVLASFYAFAEEDLSQSVQVEGLTVISTGSHAWSGSPGSVEWTGKTSSSCQGMQTVYTAKKGVLELKNSSDTTKVLTFSVEVTLNGGSVTIGGQSVTANYEFTKTLASGASVKIECNSSTKEEKTTAIILLNIKLEVQQVTTTFSAPVNGTYTVDGGTITTSTPKTNSSTKEYLLVAVPDEHFVFAGWYVDDNLASSEKTWRTSFASNGTVSARFSVDPLFEKAIVSEGSLYKKDDLLSINSQFYHDSTNKLVRDGGMPTHNSAYTLVALSQVKDRRDVQYVPSAPWQISSNLVKASATGTATGDYVTALTERSWAYARMHSDLIRIHVKKNCNISFDYTNSMTGGSTNEVYLYYYISESGNETVNTVKTKGTVVTDTSGTIDELALSEGYNLYIIMEGYATKEAMASAASLSFSFNASISNFTVNYNDQKYLLNAGFRDNVGTKLGSGKIVVNNTVYTIGANGDIASQELADGAEVKLQVNTVPDGYVHIGWTIKDKDGISNHYVDTYTHKLTSACEVYALFVPKMTVTMGDKGYEDATYKLFDGTVHSGQYIARNAEATVFYTSLAEAFENTDKVVLLAGNTFVGAWSIPQGKTLVVPFSLVDRGETSPIATSDKIGSQYCKVTIDGTLTVQGTLLISSKQYGTTGTPGGTLGHLYIESGSEVIVVGTLYAYGPIVGDGCITAKANSVVHEFVEIQDNRGPLGMNNVYEGRKTYKVFPVTAMYFNNIETAVTYHFGARLIGHAAISFDEVSQAEFNIIGSESQAALLKITLGTVTKYYDQKTGQVVFRVDRDSNATTGDFSLELSASVGEYNVDINLNSADYYLPLNSSICFEIAGNMTINGKYKFLPGATLKILESGTVVISEEACILFYRLNDYDNRGAHKNSQDQWGFSATAYPSNPTRVPGQKYQFTFTATNVGSAKLHVDGELIVYGGLYVTNDLQTDTENGIVIRDNGYNYLTGYGTIDVTEANTDLKSVYEAMAAAGTNDIKWDEVSIAPMKGLKKDATADEAAQYESLTGVMSGVLNSNELNVWLSGAPELNVAYRLDDYLWFNGYFLGANINEISEGIDMVPLEKDGVITTYIVKAIAAAEIPNDLVFTITFTLDDAQYTRQFTVNLATYDAGDDEALKQALLNYGEAAEDHFVDQNDQTANVTKPDDIPTETTPFVSQVDGVSLGNVTVTRYGMTIGFDNCLQFIYGFNVSGLTTVTENGVQYLQNASGVKVAEIGLLYSTAAGELLAQKSSYAYVLYQNPALTADSGNLPEGVTPTNKPTDSTLTPSELATMLEKNDCYMITYDMKFADYGTSYNYRLYVLFEDGSVAYGDQFAYSLETYIGNRLGSTKNPPNDTETTLLYATWDLRTAVATWLSAKGAQN